MKYRTLGKTGIKVSEIGFGAWSIGDPRWGNQDEKESIRALNKAIDNGVNLIDTAQEYGRSEQIIGEFLKKRKENIYIVTKIPPIPGIWPPSPYDNIEDRFPDVYIKEKVEKSLKMLNTEKIDILLLHTWTRAWNRNPTPLEVLNRLKKEGKINFFGISTPEQDQNSVIDIMKDGMVDVIELIFNIFEQEPIAELLPVAKEYKIGTIGRVPFDEGSLTGKYTKKTVFACGDFRNDYFKGDKLLKTIERIDKIKEEIKDTGFTLPQISLKFILRQKSINTVIPGMRKNYQVEENIKVSDLPNPPEALIERLQKHYWINNLARYFW